MKLYFWRGRTRNFGDELNTILWPYLLPGFLDDDEETLVLGIGSVLDARHASAAVKVVAGSGYGGYQPPPVLDERWVIHWVRGPRTARCLGLSESYGVGDPAMLLPLVFARHAEAGAVGFMPHFESLQRGAWPEAAAMAGLELIDPRGDPADIVASITRCRLILSEAMHGIIVADAFRVPWIALRPLLEVHRAKWYDWADALGLRIEFRDLTSSSLYEHLVGSWMGSTHWGRRLLEQADQTAGSFVRNRFVAQAAQSLTSALAASPQLSCATAMDRCRSRMLERLDALRRNPLGDALALRPGRNSAYHRGLSG